MFNLQTIRNFIHLKKSNGISNVAIFGAGSAGRELFEALQYKGRYNVSFFIDDDPNLHNQSRDKIKILSRDLARSEFSNKNISKIFIAISEIYPEGRASAIKFAVSCRLPVKIIPSLSELESGITSINSLRDITVEEVLQRKPVSAVPQLLVDSANGKSILVTGAGGSIGSELCRQILSYKPKKLLMLDNSEFGLYKLMEDLDDKNISKISGSQIIPVLGSTTELRDLRKIFQNHRIDSVFHAAAYKHVPIVENNISSGVYNNISGTINLAEFCGKHSVKSFTLISTDKAVRPTNVMGASKRLSEVIVQAYKSKFPNTQFRSVRFGNVLGSSGSVIPKFQKQILNGGPVTVTHKDVTRYFMTIPEACQLVLQASSLKDHRDIFILDMGKPIKILDIAKTMINLYGFSYSLPGEIKSESNCIEILITGLREGEKLHEELLCSGNEIATEHEYIKAENNQNCNIKNLNKILDELFILIERSDDSQIKALLAQYNLGYQPNSFL